MNAKVIGYIQTAIAILAVVAVAAASFADKLSGKTAVICGIIAVVLFGVARAWAKAGDDLKHPFKTREFWVGAVVAVATVATSVAGYVPASWGAIGATVEALALGVIAVLPNLGAKKA